MPDPHVAHELFHVLHTKDITDQTIVFAKTQVSVVIRADPRGVLATVLKDCQCIVKVLVDVVSANDSDNSAHGVKFSVSPVLTVLIWFRKRHQVAAKTETYPTL